MEEDRKSGMFSSGNTTCYQAEFLKIKIVGGKPEDDWTPIETTNHSPGVPACRMNGDLIHSLGYQTYEQSQAICWWFLARWAARPVDIKNIGIGWPRVRIRVYDFIYSLKAYHREEDNICINEALFFPSTHK